MHSIYHGNYILDGSSGLDVVYRIEHKATIFSKYLTPL